MGLGSARTTKERKFGRRERLTIGLAIIIAELFALLTYGTQPGSRITNLWLMVYPLVWIDVSLYVLYRVGKRPSLTVSARWRWTARLLATGYFAVLGHFGGLYGWFGAGRGLNIDFQLPPGASPALLYSGHPWVLVLQPYKVLGYPFVFG